MDPIRVLHVGREPGSGRVTDGLGDDEHIDLVTTTRVDEALEKVAQQHSSLDCVVSTDALPETDCLDFIDVVTDVAPELPVILQVEDGVGDGVSRALATGATDYVRMDAREDGYSELATRIEVAVDASRSEGNASSTEDSLAPAVSHVRDVTERGELNRGSEMERERMRQIFNLIPDPLFVKNEAGEFVVVNEAFAASYGLTPAELEGRTEAVIETDERAEQFREKDQEILEQGETELVYEDEFVDDDGNRQFHKTMKIPFELAGSDDPAVLGYAKDVTQLKEYERELEQKTEYLEAFARVVSHDLRNPLTVAQNRLALLKKESDSQHLPPIDRSLARMQSIIEETMSLAKEGQSVGEMETADLETLARECWNDVETGDSTLEVVSEGTIYCDRGRIRHVFENLFQNAVRHGGSTVTVRIGALEDGFYVEDDGEGVPDDIADSLFDPGETSADDGTGFGLSIVERIARAHGWSVELTDGPDGGARFEFTSRDSS